MKHRHIKKHIFPWQIISLSILALLIAVLVVINMSIQNQTAQTLTTKAAGPSCYKHCETEPSCCADIIKKMNELGGADEIMDLPDSEQPYHECPALYEAENERGYCRPSTCNQLPDGLRYRGRCGWYWSFHEGATNTADGYGCMIGPDEASMKPICSAGTNPTATPNPNPTATPPNNPSVTPQSTTCPTTSTESYDSWGLNPPDLTANTNPNTNAFLRGYGETTGELKLITYGYPPDAPPDPKAPQLNSILKNGAQFTHLYKIHKWDEANNRPSNDYENAFPVSVLSLYAKPGQTVNTPDSGYVIGAGYKAMLVFADTKSIAINWTGDDGAIDGYAAHIEGFCVDPNLLALYQQLHNEGRHKMPVLKLGQKIGTAKSNEVRIAIRDSGTFMDPRSKLDWWKNDPDVTPIPTSSNPTPTGANNIPTPTGGGTGGGANSVLVQVIDRTDPANPRLFADGSSCSSLYTNLSNRLSVYITGPDAAASGFGELLMIQGTPNCSCKSRGGFPYTCYPGAAIWKGADGTSGTAAGSYTASIQTVPQDWEKVTDSATGTLASGGSITLNLAVRQKNGSNNPTPTGNAPSITPTGNLPSITPTGNLPSPTSQISPTVIWNSYTNQDYLEVISDYTNESISAIDVSRWLNNAIRVPGLQTLICYPPNCIFQP